MAPYLIDAYNRGFLMGWKALKEHPQWIMLDPDTMQQLWKCLSTSYISHSRYPLIHDLLRRISNVQAL